MDATTISIPDYQAIADDQALKGTQLSRYNQYTPYGSSTWAQDPNNPYAWTQTSNLSPEQQNILNQQQQYSFNAGNMANNGLLGLGKLGIDQSMLPKLDTNAGDTVYQSYMNRLQPQMDQQKGSFEQQMANQGLAPGSAGYDNAYRNFSQQQNDLMLQGASNAANAQQNAYNTALNGQVTAGNTGISQINALRNGSILNNPTFQAANGSTTPNTLQAANMTTSGNLANANASNAYSSNLMSGLFGLGGTALSAGLFGK